MKPASESLRHERDERMQILEDIFDEFTDFDNEIHELLEFLKERVPDGHFQYITNRGDAIPPDALSYVFMDIQDRLVQKVQTEEKLVSFGLPNDGAAYGVPVRKYKGTLLFAFPVGKKISGLKDHGPSYVPVCVEVFFLDKALEEKENLFSIQKKQLHRQLQVQEKRYQEILEDNHRGYQIIREQQDNYSRMLKSEIERQTAELRNANKELEEKRQFQQKILDTAATAIYTVDPNRRITDVNDEFCAITGYERNEVLSHHIDILRCAPNDDLQELFASGKMEKIVKQQYAMRAKDGRELLIIKSSDILLDESGSVIGTVESFSDVTGLIKARENAESANRAKSVFLASMSHEIRTPMNSVIGFTDMLLDTELQEEQIDFAKSIKRGGELLLSLINDILDFSKVEAGRMDLECIDFDPEITAFDVCELIRTRVAKNPIEILCRIGINVPAYVKGDPERFRQVLINLMGNAAKFTQAGEIELLVDVGAQTEDKIKLHVMVRDTGIGIHKEKLDSIFNAFQQADDSTTRKYGGTGLGLSICRKIAALMNGEIWAESPVPLEMVGVNAPAAEPGSVFHFTSWLEKSNKKPENKLVKISLANLRVLVVDDNQVNLEIIRHILESVGMQVVCIKNGKQVVPTLQEAAAGSNPFSLCIVDILLGDMNGVDVAKAVRGQVSEISQVPLLAFSSSMDTTARSCREVGFDGFLPKPIRRDRLYKMLERLLIDTANLRDGQANRSEREIATQHSVREKTKHSMQILLAEDNKLNQKLAVLMLKSAGYQVEVANDGQAAIDKYSAAPDQYDMVFMDIQMPNVDGLSATKAIRKVETDRSQNTGSEQRIPIVAMTANAMKGDREKCLGAGMDDYVAKPIKREVVFKMVDKWILKRNPLRRRTA